MDMKISGAAEGENKFVDWSRFHQGDIEASDAEVSRIVDSCDYFCVNDCGDYLDHEFYPQGDLRTRFVVSKEVSNGRWYGTVFLAEDDKAPFIDEATMP